MATIRALQWNTLNDVPVVLDYAPLFGRNDAVNTASDINDLGFAVGRTYKTGVGYQAVLWDPQGDAFLLDDLLNLPGYQFLWADSINNHGWITAYAQTPDGSYRAVLLEPRPRAFVARVVLITLAVLMLTFKRFRRKMVS